MTNMEKRQITRLREQGLGDMQIANRLGISKSTVSTFCQRNSLAEDKKEKPQKPNNSLRSGALRVNTVTTDPRPTTVGSCNDDAVKITCIRACRAGFRRRPCRRRRRVPRWPGPFPRSAR